MLFPVTFTIDKYRKNTSNKVFNLWAIAVALLMLQNYSAPFSLQVVSFFPAWFILGAAVFYYTSERLPPPSDKTYLYAAGINLVLSPVYIVNIYAAPFVAALVQGGPMIYDWYTVHSGREKIKDVRSRLGL